MKIEVMTTEQDLKDNIMRMEVTAEDWAENKMLAESMGIKTDEPDYIECKFDLKKLD